MFLFLKTVLENGDNTENTKKNCYWLFEFSVFCVFRVFSGQKRKGNQTCFQCFPSSPCFIDQKTVFKNDNQTGSIASSFCTSFAFSMYVVSSQKIALQVQVYMSISIQSCMRFLCGFTLILDLIKI